MAPLEPRWVRSPRIVPAPADSSVPGSDGLLVAPSRTRPLAPFRVGVLAPRPPQDAPLVSAEQGPKGAVAPLREAFASSLLQDRCPSRRTPRPDPPSSFPQTPRPPLRIPPHRGRYRGRKVPAGSRSLRAPEGSERHHGAPVRAGFRAIGGNRPRPPGSERAPTSRLHREGDGETGSPRTTGGSPAQGTRVPGGRGLRPAVR